jgi:putative flippase GtrA
VAADLPATLKLPGAFARYLVVGLLGTALHFLGTIALVEWAGVSPVPASIVAFALTLVVSFGLNSRYTFDAPDRPLVRLARYALVSVSGLGLNTLIMYLATATFGAHYLWGLCLVVLVIPPYNFTLNLLWTFRSSR